jgi:hypothetical protein
MTKDRPAVTNRQDDFVGQLSAQQKRIFKQLQKLLAEADHDLRWHWRVGQRLLDLRGDHDRWPTGGVKDLAEALGCSPAFLTKSVACARTYREEEAADLDGRGVGWDQFVIAMAVPGKSRRLQFLRQARAGGWSTPRLRAEVRRELGQPPHAGGRKQRSRREVEAVEHLLELLSRSRSWGRYVSEGQWAGKPPDVLSKLAEETDEPEGLLTQLRELDAVLKAMGKSIARVRAALPELIGEVEARGRRRGGR